MGKLIYADALIEDIKAQTALLRALGNEDITKIADLMEKGFVEEIDKQPTIEERKWIPCSERLPEENTPVLLGVRFKDDFKYFVTARMDYNYWQGLGRDIRGEMRWRRLPEPWKGEE